MSFAAAVLLRSADVVVGHPGDRAVQQPQRLVVQRSCSATRSSPVSSSTTSRHTRCRNRYAPTTSLVAHGRDASSGPIDIS